MPSNKEYRWGIQTKLSLVLGILVLFSLASFGLLSYIVTKNTLDNQMGNLLVSQAEMAVAMLRSESVWLSEMTMPGQYIYSILQEKLASARTRSSNLDNIILIGSGDKIIADAKGELQTGSEYPILKAEQVELKLAWKGSSEASVLYPGKYGRAYKSAYAPVITKDSKVVAVVRVEASADFLSILNRTGVILLIIALAITAMAALLGAVIARSIVIPVKKLMQASQRISSGDLDTEVLVESRDEIGFFAQTFNQMAKNLKKLYEEVAERGRQIVELSASVAHEVRSPINAIQGFTELLEDEIEKDDPRLEYIDDIKKEIKILNSKVTDFIHFARPLVIEPNPLDIIETLENALASMDKEIVDNNISVITKFDSSLPAVMGDFEQLRGLFVNLIRNAIQAMSSGGELAIMVNGNIQDANIHRKFVEIRVEDNGCGMSPEEIELAFEPFFTTKSSGTGLGLSIVKKIVSAHNGDIKLESVLKAGTTVKVFLPVQANGLED